jgi:hypothetical protein
MVLVFQLILLRLFSRPKRRCDAGWVRAGFTRRGVVKMWALTFLMFNGRNFHCPITDRDIFAIGTEKAANVDVQRVHEKLALWLDYWSACHPTDTLEQAMLNLLVRLVKAKDGWQDERGDEQFPFNDVMDAIVAGRLEPYIDGKV